VWGWWGRVAVLVAAGTLAISACSSDDGDDEASRTASTSDPVASAPIPRRELEQMLADFLESTGAPGGVIGVARGDEDPLYVTSGVTRFEGDTPVAADDLFLVASNTKIFTGAIVLQLAEEEQIDLDATIDTYLPGWPGGERVTVRQLLTHTSGYPSWCDDHSAECTDAIVAQIDRSFPLDEVLAYTRGRPLLFEPGTGAHYSNVNSQLLAKVAEVVTGRPLAELYRTRLLDPLDLRHTYYSPDETPPERPVGGLFELAGQPADFGGVPYISTASMLGPAGGMVATVGDLIAWGRALWRDGEVLQPDTLAEATDFSSYGTGLGMLGFSREIRGFCVFSGCPEGVTFDGPGGSGEISGTVTALVFDEQLDSVVSVAITSSYGVSAEQLTADVLDIVEQYSS
jgi:D-alanyl-D-alanine carboxypeptidase